MIICFDPISGTGCKAHNGDGALRCSTCGHSLTGALRALNPATLIHSFRIKRLIGQGGFGVVYQAVHVSSGDRFALKEAFSPALVQSMRGELAALKRLYHPNLPRYLDVIEHQGKGYLIMEFVPGQNLDDVLAKTSGPLLEGQVLGYAMQLCDALTYLHNQNPPVTHRDIKPANIRLTPEGVIKLVDFGLFKQGSATTHSSRRGGTPLYAPIEQFAGSANLTSPRTDIYSLGATLYHLLTGIGPAMAGDRISAQQDPLIPPKNVNSTISLHISDAIVHAMAIIANNRFSSAEEFKQALQGGAARLAPSVQVHTTIKLSPGVHPTPSLICSSCTRSCDPHEIYCQQCSNQLLQDTRCPCGKATVPRNASYCPHCGKTV